jgi:hypothetical protein
MTDKTTRVKCPNCGNKWKIIGQVDDNFDADTTCPDCHFAASAWNFIENEDDEDYHWREQPYNKEILAIKDSLEIAMKTLDEEIPSDQKLNFVEDVKAMAEEVAKNYPDRLPEKNTKEE